MDCLKAFRPYVDMPWFDDFSEAREQYKVHHDGSHYVALKFKPPEARKKVYKAPPREKWHIDELFDEAYLKGLSKNLSGSSLKNFIKERISEFYPDYPDLDDFISKYIRRKSRNLYQRCKRFRRKAYNYNWSYMVTFTYDDKKMNEETFRFRLKKRFSKLASEKGWLIMGAFERGDKNYRLHFHGVAYVPKNQMVGTLEKRKDYSIKEHRFQEILENSYFSKYFGRNDFKEISVVDVRRGILEYILKYIEKGGERIYYSRGIKTEVEAWLLPEDILGSETIRNNTIFYLFDDVIDVSFHFKKNPYIDGIMFQSSA